MAGHGRSPITRKHGWFAGEDQLLQWRITRTDEDITDWTLEFRMGPEPGATEVLVLPVFVFDTIKKLARCDVAAADTDSIPGNVVYYYEMIRTDVGNEQVLAYGPAYLGARVV